MAVVHLTYSKKAKKFNYTNNRIGGKRFVKDELAQLIQLQLPKKLSNKKAVMVYIQRPNKSDRYYEVTVTA